VSSVVILDQVLEIDFPAAERQRVAPSDVFTTGPFVGLPRGHYRIAHIDPPWTFHAWSHRGDGKGACQHYKCQTLDDIVALPVDELMAPDAAIFLWTVQPMYPEAMRVLEAWGFLVPHRCFCLDQDAASLE
jgi:MT-A70 protein